MNKREATKCLLKETHRGNLHAVKRAGFGTVGAAGLWEVS